MKMLRGVLTLALLTAALIPSAAHAQDITITLLGTGCPPAVMNRFGPSILVEAGGQKFLFDAGRGALQRLNQVKVKWQDVRGVFFTHLHSDHVVGFPDLWLTGWLTPGRSVPLNVWGPRGTKNMMSHLEQAFDFDIRIRLYDDRSSPDGIVLLTEEIGEGVVYDKGGVKITAFEVDHAPIKPAFGYRVDHAGRSIVLSGDTRVSDNLILARPGGGCACPRSGSTRDVPARRRRTRAGQKRRRPSRDSRAGGRSVLADEAVYSHIVLPIATEQDLNAGPLELGEDLMVIEVGRTIEVRRPARPSS